MSSIPDLDDTLRAAILRSPDVILDDKEVMRALIAANDRTMGENIVDMRGIAMDRLESRLDRLEDTHRSVIAAAYDNLAGTNQVHRAVLALLDPPDFDSFLHGLGTEVAEILRVDAVTLVIESVQSEDDPALERLSDVVKVVRPGYVAAYLAQGRSVAPRPVTLRPVLNGSDLIYGDSANWIRSEACLMLDLGEGCMPGLLVLGSEDPQLFSPQHGTDLLAFFGSAFERVMRRWLS